MSIKHNASERLRLALAELSTALDRLDEALALPLDTPLLVDGTMQRFEFCFELAWKSLKLALSEWEGLGGSTLGSVAGAIFGALIGAATGGVTGAKLGEVIDQRVLDNYVCQDCGLSFSHYANRDQAI